MPETTFFQSAQDAFGMAEENQFEMEIKEPVYDLDQYTEYIEVDGVIVQKADDQVDIPEEPLAVDQEKPIEEKQVYQCDHCDYSSFFKLNLIRHVISKHAHVKSVKNNPQTHGQSAHTHHKAQSKEIAPEKRFKCAKCDYRTESRKLLRKHEMRKTPCKAQGQTKWHECEHCQYKTQQKHNLAKHINARHTSAEDRILYKCEQCGFQAKTQATIRYHKIMRHLPDDQAVWFKCDKCDYQNKLKIRVARHERKHQASSSGNTAQ